MNKVKSVSFVVVISLIINISLSVCLIKESYDHNYDKAILFDEIVKNRLGVDYDGSVIDSGVLKAKIKFSNSEKLKTILVKVEKDLYGQIGKIEFIENNNELTVVIR